MLEPLWFVTLCFSIFGFSLAEAAAAAVVVMIIITVPMMARAMVMMMIIIIIVTGQPWENGLNWIPDPAPAASRPKEEENHPPASHPPRLPSRLRPRRMKRTPQKHPLPVAGTTNRNSPGTDLRPRWMKRTPKKHPLPVAGTANENSPGTDLRPPALPSYPAAQSAPWNLDIPCRLYKQARRSRVKQFSKRPRRDHFSETPFPLHSKRPRRDYFSETPLHSKAGQGPVSELLLQPQTRRGSTSESSYQAGPQGGAISLPQNDCHSAFHHPQSIPCSARPDLVLEVGLEPPAVNLASRIPCEDQQVAGNPASHVRTSRTQSRQPPASRMRTYLL